MLYDLIIILIMRCLRTYTIYLDQSMHAVHVLNSKQQQRPRMYTVIANKMLSNTTKCFVCLLILSTSVKLLIL